MKTLQGVQVYTNPEEINFNPTSVRGMPLAVSPLRVCCNAGQPAWIECRMQRGHVADLVAYTIHKTSQGPVLGGMLWIRRGYLDDKTLA